MREAAQEIKKLWRILALGKGSVVEIRALQPKGFPGNRRPLTKHFRETDYTSVESLKKDIENFALQANQDGYNVYSVMNPIRSDFVGPGCARDKDILYRDLLLIDIDRVGHRKAPANQFELDAAKSLAAHVRSYMNSFGCGPPITLMSGNGYHLYYVLRDVDNNLEAETAVATLLQNLATLFNNDVVGIDTTVYNASRITKVAGTVMRKGISTEDRPYRMAVVCDE